MRLFFAGFEALSENVKVFRNVFHLLNWMKKYITYGWLDKKFRSNTESFDIWFENVRIHQGNHTYKYKVGTCYEQTIFATDVFKRDFPNLKTKVFHIQVHSTKSKSNIVNHLTLFYEYKNKWFWFEPAWKAHSGIHGKYSSIKELKSVIEKFYSDEYKNRSIGFIWNEIDQDKLLEKSFTAREFYDLVKYDWRYK